MCIHYVSRCQGVETGVFACMCVHLALGGMSQGSGRSVDDLYACQAEAWGVLLAVGVRQRNQGAAESIRIQLEFQELLPDLGR